MRRCIEKSFSTILAVVLLTLLCSAFFVCNASAADSGTQISVDIIWDSVQFTYSGGTWNPETHTYENGSWSTEGGNFTVTNHSSVRVVAEFTYTPSVEMGNIFGSFTKPRLTLPVAGSAATKLSLGGAPSKLLANDPLGIVTIMIKPLGASSGEDEGEWDINPDY